MNKQYQEIEFKWGSTLEDVVNSLLNYKEQGKLVCGDFNGTNLYSDTVTMDKAYIEVHGKNKSEFDKMQQEWREDLKRRDEEHKKQIPELTKQWVEKGRKILTEDKWKYWDEIVPIRLGDLYKGMELGNCLDIVELLSDGGTLDEAKEMIYDQGHSGMSFGLVRAMVEEFSDRGKEFTAYVNRGEDII